MQQQADKKQALYSLTPDCDREQWVKIAMAFKAAGGEFETFDAWSSKAPSRYDKSNCRQTWDGIKPTGGITAATLYAFAKEAGYIFQGKEQKRSRMSRTSVNTTPAIVTKVYEYRDRSGNLRMLNIRYEPKDFRPRYALVDNPDPIAFDDTKQWARTKPDRFMPPLYHEDEIAKRPNETIYLLEGEKDADNLAKLGYLTSCHKAGGTVIHSGHGLLIGRHVVIIADADEPGAKYAEEALEKLKGECASVAIIAPPKEFKDYSEWEEAQDSTASMEELRSRFETWGIPPEKRDTCETLASVWDNPPERSPELIAGLLRQGHKMILSGPAKAGKSFALLQLAAALCEGREWLHIFPCRQSKILYLNLEIDRPSMIQRACHVYKTLGWTPHELDNFIFDHLRGRTDNIEELAADIIQKTTRHEVNAVFIDPVYKCGLEDENSAGDITRFCRILDKIASNTGAAVIYCHHFSKGAQDGKNAIDRASGSGVFARDADAILTLTELQEPGGYRLECILREFKSPEPLSLRFEYPLHIPAPELDFCPLKGARGVKMTNAKREADESERQKKEDRERILIQIVEIAMRQKKMMQKTTFIETVMGRLGISKDFARASVAALLDDGRLTEKAEPENNNRKLIAVPKIMEQPGLN